MQIKISKSLLASALSGLGPIVGRNKAMLILNNIKVVTKGNKIRLQATDAETTIRKYVEAESIGQDCEFLVEFAALNSFINKIKSESLTLALENNTLTVKHAKGKASFQTLPPEDFVEPKTYDDAIENVISTQDLARLVAVARNFVSFDDFQASMRPIRAIIADNSLTICATDTRKLFVDSVQLSPEAKDTQWYIEQSIFSSLISACKNADTAVVKVSDKNVSYKIGTTTIYTQQTQGRFPDFTRVLPKTHVTDVLCKKADIVDAVQRASLFVEKGVDLLKVAISVGGINIHADNVGKLQQATEHITCESAANVEFGVNSRYFLDCANACDSADVKLELNGPSKPIVIKDGSNPDRVVLCMPMSITNA